MRTVIDVNDEALAAAAKVLGTTTKVATINRALEEIAARPERMKLIDSLMELEDLSNPEIMRGARW
ncbi:type II toxin-antitoxin system VapB family antitoxin [Aquihabitans sp. McL0605]|uniref:type II toxin-antitoxin system VapB family antitoxin n=1 Tax=Aquihabitans sp. McL0605 TaxID=3415671 RepID=UPI003CEAC4A0